MFLVVITLALIVVYLVYRDTNVSRVERDNVEQVVDVGKLSGKDINIIRLLKYLKSIVPPDLDTLTDLVRTCDNVILISSIDNDDRYELARQQSVLALGYLESIRYSIHPQLVPKIDESYERLRFLLSRHLITLADINDIQVPPTQ